MSVSDFEDQVMNWIWRGLVIAGLVTVLGSVLTPTPNPQVQGMIQGQTQGATNTASNAGSSTTPPQHNPRSGRQAQ